MIVSSFCRATEKTARTMRQALDYYCAVSSQLINYRKLKFNFSRNVTTMDKKEINQILQVTPTGNIDKYLGCPNIDATKRTTQDLNDLKRKIGQKLARW